MERGELATVVTVGFVGGMRVEEIAITVLAAAAVFGIPTGAMYRRTKADEVSSPQTWTGVMLALSVFLPILGPVLLWIVYAVSVGEGRTGNGSP